MFAEAYDPEADDDDDGATAVFPKTDEQRARLIESVKNVLLFRSLEKEQVLTHPFNLLPAFSFLTPPSKTHKSLAYFRYKFHTHTHTQNTTRAQKPKSCYRKTESRCMRVSWVGVRKCVCYLCCPPSPCFLSLSLSSIPLMPFGYFLCLLQMNQVLDAMFERKVQPGDFIIRQGDDGDNFYVIESWVQPTRNKMPTNCANNVWEHAPISRQHSFVNRRRRVRN